MARRKPSLPILLLFLILLIVPSGGVQFGQWQNLISLSHSLLNRVANVRSSRGDFEGAERAGKMADKLGGRRGFGLWGGLWSMGLDYVKNYAWRDIVSDLPSTDIFSAVSDMSEILVALNELTRFESDRQRVKWVSQNYQRILRVSGSLFRRLLAVFFRPGPLREMVLLVQEEVQGNLLQDCLEVGGNDLKGLLQVARDILLNRVSSPSGSSHSYDDL